VIALFKLGPKKSWLMEGLRNSAAVACTIFTILIGGLIFSRLLVITGVVTEFTQFVSAHIHTAAGIMVAFSLMYIIMGCSLDTASMMIITLPFVFQVIVQYGINPIWFGIIFVKVIEISVITPPVGLNLYAVMSYSIYCDGSYHADNFNCFPRTVHLASGEDDGQLISWSGTRTL
jgi:TRAP-type C4-dicarboxylate transport system permease large subunit